MRTYTDTHTDTHRERQRQDRGKTETDRQTDREAYFFSTKYQWTLNGIIWEKVFISYKVLPKYLLVDLNLDWKSKKKKFKFNCLIVCLPGSRMWEYFWSQNTGHCPFIRLSLPSGCSGLQHMISPTDKLWSLAWKPSVFIWLVLFSWTQLIVSWALKGDPSTPTLCVSEPTLRTEVTENSKELPCYPGDGDRVCRWHLWKSGAASLT